MRKSRFLGMGGGLVLGLGALGFTGAPAEAQLANSFYVVTNAPGSYATLGSSGSAVKKVTGTDLGAYDLNLSGWSFPYFKSTYSDIWISADGFLSVLDSTNSANECSCVASNGTCDQGARYNCGSSSPNCGGGCCVGANGKCAAVQFGFCGSGSFGCCSGSTPYPPACPAAIADYNMDYSYPPGQCQGANCSRFGGTIAGWWKWLDDAPGKGISYLSGGATGAHFLTVDYHGVWDSYYETNNYLGGQYNFAITLWESGIVEVDYGPYTLHGSASSNYSPAFATLTSPDQSDVILGPSCGMNGYTNQSGSWSCSLLSNNAYCGCTPNLFPANQTFFYGQPAGVAFYPQVVSTSNASEDLNGKLTFDVDTTALNIGQSDVSGSFTDNVYFESTFQTSDKLSASCATADCLVAKSQSVTIPAGGSAVLGKKSISMTLPADGIYTLEEWLDPTNSTGNGLAGKLGSSTFEIGVDLTGSIGVVPLPGGIPGPTGPCFMPGRLGTGPNQKIPITLQNLGSRVAPSTSYRIWASRTNTLPFDTSATTPNIAFAPPGSANLGGFDTQGPQCIPITVPSVAEGDYYLALQLDPDGAYPGDVNPANNIVFTESTVHISPPHLRVTDVVGPSNAYQGRPLDIGFTLASDGASEANGFSIGVLLVPQGGSLTTTSYKVVQYDNVSLQAGCTIEVRNGLVVFSSSDGCYVWPPVATQAVVAPNQWDSRKTPAGTYNLGVIADITNLVLPRLGRDTNHLEAPTTTVVQLPLPDFSILGGDINAPASTLAGSQVLVERNIRNIGVSSASTTYGYFLNLNSKPNVLEVNQGGIPIPVVVPTGELTYTPTVTLDYPGSGQSEDRGADLLVIPSTLAPPLGAQYTLTLVLDPMNQLVELDKSNNMAGVGPITVTRTDLSIRSANPPAALPDVPYSFNFAATGGFGAYSWSIVAGALPPHMTLSTDGALSGTPTDLGVWTLLVGVSSGGQTQVASVAFSVAPPSGPLQLVKSGLELPPATVGEAYAAQLAAQGGTPPYSWIAKTSSVPEGLNLSQSGLLSGVPTQNALTTTGAASIAVTVTDQAGNTKFDTYLLEVVGPGDLVITTTDIPPQQVGQPWLQDLSASGCKGTCHWTIPPGQLLPPGLELNNQGSGPTTVGHLSGILTQSGIWFFEVQVTDDNGHVATRHYRLQVEGSRLTLPTQTLPPATVGVGYPGAQLVGPSGVGVTWLLYSGDLPPGLTMKTDGSINGTVPATAGVRPYAFTVSAQDSQGNESLQAEVIKVQAVPVKKTGCSTGAGGLAPLGLIGLGLLWSRRRK
jgi:MYXO-CTERM domain-containing protein